MSGEAPLPHEEAAGLLDALRDGELSAEEAARVEAHVESCDRCRTVEAALGGSLRKAVQGGAAEGEADLLPGVQRRLRLRSRGRFYADGEEPQRPAVSPWPLLVASVALLVALAAGYIALGQMGAPTSIAPAPSASGR